MAQEEVEAEDQDFGVQVQVEVHGAQAKDMEEALTQAEVDEEVQ